ncbi:hypothetical protein [Paraburkholderia sp. BL21I4N1]|uniref:hypothetical protein n=1 Tax=Paraburkholderia sp. BL21I4N1 TaxID=1938801 RepID=UPI000CFB75F3|nr:hypothetical protein [Paraburkholderia sp. BL21I4N1]PQV48077.1 hypothetical protein B0G83_109163 [Paraburkholderia sp. BL21I4N1]
MNDRRTDTERARQEHWLTRYYFMRAAFSAVWVGLAFSIGQISPAAVAALLVVYPAWDALANYIDMSRAGGMAEGRIQAINVVISILTTIAVIVALRVDMSWVLGVFGDWAILSGLLQLGTAARRWKHFGAQWAMILSGAQSALAGAFFIVQARAAMPPVIARVAAYAAVGAIYFLVSALWLSVSRMRRKAL